MAIKIYNYNICVNPREQRTSEPREGSSVSKTRALSPLIGSSNAQSVSLVRKTNVQSVKIDRRYPPVSLNDTIDESESLYGKEDLFSDKEIVRVHKAKDYRFSDEYSNITIAFSKYNKAIIQQQSIRGCTAASAAMLIFDRGGKISIYELMMRNAGDTEDICSDIIKAGFVPRVLQNFSKDLEALKKEIQKMGPAIITINCDNLGGHVVVVDDINDKTVRLRDPYHGWEITVLRTALEKIFFGGDVIQIQ
jgi:hypothetical protein